MGGLGSGRKRNTDAVPFCEEAESVSVSTLAEQARDSGKSVAWLLWEWCRTKRVVRLPEVVFTTPYYGGRRAWFACPNCGERKGILYTAWDEDNRTVLSCRTCLGLVYEIRNADKGARRLRECSRLRVRLYRGSPVLGAVMQTLEAMNPEVVGECPSRPKRLHRATYQRMKEQHDAAMREGYDLKIEPMLARAQALTERSASLLHSLDWDMVRYEREPEALRRKEKQVAEAD